MRGICSSLKIFKWDSAGSSIFSFALTILDGVVNRASCCTPGCWNLYIASAATEELNDRFVDLSHNSVEALLKLDEDRLIADTENGLISLVGILPNRVIQPIAEHSEYPVEGLAFSHDRRFLGSISHDQMLKVCISPLYAINSMEVIRRLVTVSTCNNSENTGKGQAASSDSDSEEMDVDDNPPRSKKGTKTKKCKQSSWF
ncbi:protein cornichon-like protein 1-like [Hibiscus syriacus]|uniref:Protein cornichon-like protein 1-like n=1 Tax=Hibiscus syriacus TaxID=106335 RepID=A0A6A2ZEG2_HIBSY|nr:protein cornichon-like protein 1-like [Hibiscus syriacus]